MATPVVPAPSAPTIQPSVLAAATVVATPAHPATITAGTAPAVHAAPPPMAQATPSVIARPTAAPPRGQAPPPRVIVPQTGPRPVYKQAPVRPAAPTAQTGAPMRPAPGRPVPGQPISSVRVPARRLARVRHFAGERRPMHPTRQSPPELVRLELAQKGHADGIGAPGQSPRRSRAQAGPALRSARGEGRPYEGLRPATSAHAFPTNRSRSPVASPLRRESASKIWREIRDPRERPDWPPARPRSTCHRQSDAEVGTARRSRPGSRRRRRRRGR